MSSHNFQPQMGEYRFKLVHGSCQRAGQPVLSKGGLEKVVKDIIAQILAGTTFNGVTMWDRPDVAVQTVYVLSEDTIGRTKPDYSWYRDSKGGQPANSRWYIATNRKEYDDCIYEQGEKGGELYIPGLYEEKLHRRVASLAATVEEQKSLIGALTSLETERAATLESLEAKLEKQNDTIGFLEAKLAGRESTIDTLLASAKDRDASIEGFKQLLDALSERITEMSSSRSDVDDDRESLEKQK